MLLKERYFKYKEIAQGVSAVVQYVKNLTEVAWVAVEAWVQSPAQHSGLIGSRTAAVQTVTVARTQSLAWELPYAVGVAIKKRKDPKAVKKKLNNVQYFPL